MAVHDPQLVGCWRVISIDMIVGRAVSLITGRPGDIVQFTEDGHYGIANRNEERWECPEGDPPHLDIWFRGWKRTKCIYEVEGSMLRICVPDRDRPRPKRLEKHTAWRWSLMTLERCDCPPQPPKPKPRPRIIERRVPMMDSLRRELKTNAWPETGTLGVEVGWFPVAPLTIRSGHLWAGDSQMVVAEVNYPNTETFELSAGEYIVSALVMAFGKGRFIARLRVCLSGIDSPSTGVALGNVGTDSASIGVCDPIELAATFKARFGDDVNDAVQWLEDYPLKDCGVMAPKGDKGASLVYTQSGFGDGVGPVIALLHDGRRVGVELPYIDDNVAP